MRRHETQVQHAFGHVLLQGTVHGAPMPWVCVHAKGLYWPCSDQAVEEGLRNFVSNERQRVGAPNRSSLQRS
jgi:hypothetical protein